MVLVWFEYWDDFTHFPDVWDVIVDYCLIEDVCEGPNGYRPKMFQVSVRRVDPVDFVLSNTILVMLGVKGRGGSLRGTILLCVLLGRGVAFRDLNRVPLHSNKTPSLRSVVKKYV